MDMKTCIIFCAAGFDGLLSPIPSDALVIAADGGLRHTEALGITPDVILGDFDSLGYVPAGSHVFPVEKDDTDAMLAVRLGLEKGFDRFVIYGGLDGPRLDHTVANLQTLCYLAHHGAQGWLFGKDYTVTAVKDGRLEFPATSRGVISLFCFGEPACVSIEGLKYTLEKGSLKAISPWA
jgi:thiamine pyrophosphokinase